MTTHAGNEVEIKFLIHDVEALTGTLRSVGFRQKTPSSFESNTLYDNDANDLRNAGELLRLRHYNLKWKLTHKSRGAAGKHKSRTELETELSSGETMHAILTAIGFRPVFRYEKYRAEWSDGQGEVVIDHTPIGILGEIEGDPAWIDRIARELGLREADYITGSYSELFFVWRKRTGNSATNMTFAECGTPHPF
jgi:adenylate cyclase class 2